MGKIVSGGFLLVLYCGVVILVKLLFACWYIFLIEEESLAKEVINFIKLVECGIYLGLSVIATGLILY